MRHETFSTPGAVKLEISIPSGDVDVETVDGDTTAVELEAGAAREGVSLNTWLVRALSRSTAPLVRRSGNRLTGYGRN